MRTILSRIIAPLGFEVSTAVHGKEGMRMDAWFVPDTPFNRVHVAQRSR